MLCKCRVWKEGYGGICSRKGIIQNEYTGRMMCRGHNDKVNEENGDWWLGYIDEPRPNDPLIRRHIDPNGNDLKYWVAEETPEEQLERDYQNQTIRDDGCFIFKQDNKYYRVDTELHTGNGYRVRLPFEDTLVGEYNEFEECITFGEFNDFETCWRPNYTYDMSCAEYMG